MASDCCGPRGDAAGADVPAGVESRESRPTDQPAVHPPQSRRRRKALVALCVLLVVLGWLLCRQGENPTFQEAKIRCLGKIGSPAAPLLVRIVRNESDMRVYAMAIMELRGMKAAASPALVDALLEEDDPDKRPRLLYALFQVGAAETDVRRVAQAISDPRPEVRRHAAQMLPWVNAGPAVAVPALIEALRDSDPAVQFEAALTLSFYGPSATAAIPALESLAKPPDSQLRRKAAETLDVVRGKTHPYDDD